MKRLVVLTFATVVMALMVGTGMAHESLPEHPHMLILGLEFEGEEVVGIRKCVDLAGGKELPLNSQHENVHTGPAGEALLTRAGHLVIPAAPFPEAPFANCAELEAALF